MSVLPVATPRVSTRAVKKQDAPAAQRKRKAPALDYDDEDWVPLASTMTPTRVIREFIENDYDMM